MNMRRGMLKNSQTPPSSPLTHCLSMRDKRQKPLVKNKKLPEDQNAHHFFPTQTQYPSPVGGWPSLLQSVHNTIPRILVPAEDARDRDLDIMSRHLLASGALALEDIVEVVDLIALDVALAHEATDLRAGPLPLPSARRRLERIVLRLRLGQRCLQVRLLVPQALDHDRQRHRRIPGRPQRRLVLVLRRRRGAGRCALVN